MDDVWKVITFTEETENLTVVVQELLLAWHFAAAKSLLLVFTKLTVVWTSNLDLALAEGISWLVLALWLWISQIHEELSSVLIAVGDADSTSVNSDIKTHAEILRHEWAHSVTLKHHLAVEEGTLWHTRVDLLWLNHENGLVLKEVVDQE